MRVINILSLLIFCITTSQIVIAESKVDAEELPVEEQEQGSGGEGTGEESTGKSKEEVNIEKELAEVKKEIAEISAEISDDLSDLAEEKALEEKEAREKGEEKDFKEKKQESQEVGKKENAAVAAKEDKAEAQEVDKKESVTAAAEAVAAKVEQSVEKAIERKEVEDSSDSSDKKQQNKVESKQEAQQDPGAKPLSASQAEFEAAIAQIRKAQEEAKARGAGGRRKLRIGILTRHMVGGHFMAAAAVKKALEDKLRDECEVEVINTSDDGGELPNFYKRISTKSGLKKEVLNQRAFKFISRLNLYYFGILEFFFNKGIFREFISKNILDLNVIQKVIDSKFDILISTCPHVHEIINRKQITKQNRTIVISIPTDPDDYSDLYIRNKNALYLIYSDKHKELLKKRNCPHYKQISGLPLRQEFADIRRISKSDAKKELGFDPNDPVVIVSFGAAGSDGILEVAKLLAEKQCILICASNKEVKAKLEAMGNKKHRVEGFVDAEQMAKRMRAADISIGKPGFASVSEAIQSETIYISLDSLVTASEETSEEFFIENKLGTKAKIEELAKVVDEVLADPTYKRALAKMQNNGAQEVAAVVKDVIDNYEDWQDRLWGKRRIVLLKMGDFGGHHESAKAIKTELEKRNLSRWIIEERSVIGLFEYKFIYANVMRYLPIYMSLHHKMRSLVLKISGIDIEGRTNYIAKDANNIVILCTPKTDKSIELIKNNNSKNPMITVVTDFKDFREKNWLGPSEPLYLLGTHLLLDQAKQLDLPNVMPTSGMVIRQEFKNVCKMSKAQAKEKMGFDASEPVICVCYGSAGYYKIRQLADMLKDRNVIFVCGSYSQMKDELEKLGNKKHKILGYADNQTMATCLRASDVVIGKPGPGILSEAWQCECVPICEGGDVVMIQEKACEKDIRDNKRGIIVDKFEDIPAAIQKILSDPIYKRNCSAVYNNSLTQVCDVIQNVTENYGWWQERLWGEGDKKSAKESKSSESKPLSASQAEFEAVIEQIRKAQEEAKARGAGGRRKLRVGILTRHMVGGHFMTAEAVKKVLEDKLVDECEIEMINTVKDINKVPEFYKEISTKAD